MAPGGHPEQGSRGQTVFGRLRSGSIRFGLSVWICSEIFFTVYIAEEFRRILPRIVQSKYFGWAEENLSI